jgi:hypothetical protein
MPRLLGKYSHRENLAILSSNYLQTTEMMRPVIWGYWVFGLCPSSGFFLNNNEKHNVSETGSVSVLR